MRGNPQDDYNGNLEIDIHPCSVQMVNKGSTTNKGEIDKLKDFLDSKLQA